MTYRDAVTIEKKRYTGYLHFFFGKEKQGVSLGEKGKKAKNLDKVFKFIN